MKTQNYFKPIVIITTIVALLSMSFKVKPVVKSYDNFLPKEVFRVTYSYFAKGNNEQIFIKSFLPESTTRQKIENLENVSKDMISKTEQEDENQRLIWRSTTLDDRFYEVDFSFDFKGKAKRYNISENIPADITTNVDAKYLATEKYIETNDTKIDSLASSLTQNATDLKSKIKSLFDYVYAIPSAPIKDVTTALTTLNQQRASCNGKSRLLVALARSQNIPARLVGGLIVAKAEKRTSHLWVEIYIQGTWVPFDALNGHFAYIPANFLELYRGDHFLITRTANILFDYEYKIDNLHHIPLLSFSEENNINKHPFSLINLSKSGIMPKDVLNFLLLLPLGGLLIALFKNVVGLKTYGIFLPVLIAYTLTNTGYFVGLLLFTVIVLIVALVSLPLNKWGLLYTPKIVIILTVTVLSIFILMNIGITYNIEWILALSFFPIIITAIMAERFARAIDEDGYELAGSKMAQTLIATSFCYLVFNSVVIKSLMLVFPELIVISLTTNLMLGKWIGLRLAEYKRFKFIIQ